LNLLLPILAILPGLLISYFIFRVDKYEREPFVPLALCFAIGALLTIPAIQFEKWTLTHIGTHDPKGFFETFWLSFIVVALPEEFLKYGALRGGVFPRRFFNEPLDGIVYAVLIGMGFAAMENLAYADRFGIDTMLLRTFTAVPAHLVFAIVQGYYTGLAKFNPARRRRLLWQGFGLSVLLHGIYDFLIFQDWSDWLFVVATLALYMCLFFCVSLIREHLHNSPFRKNNTI